MALPDFSRAMRREKLAMLFLPNSIAGKMGLIEAVLHSSCVFTGKYCLFAKVGNGKVLRRKTACEHCFKPAFTESSLL
jgi:hypothetical protein